MFEVSMVESAPTVRYILFFISLIPGRRVWRYQRGISNKNKQRNGLKKKAQKFGFWATIMLCSEMFVKI